MTVVLRQSEAAPASYPTVPGLSTAAAALDADALWQRLESYIAHRWTPREVTWTVRGPGEFVPWLTPATVTTTERWFDLEWQGVTPDPSPLGGLMLPTGDVYRIIATVGSGDPPAAVLEAYRRLAEYLASGEGKAGASAYRFKVGDLEEDVERAPTWVARALQYSGAADLL